MPPTASLSALLAVLLSSTACAREKVAETFPTDDGGDDGIENTVTGSEVAEPADLRAGMYNCAFDDLGEVGDSTNYPCVVATTDSGATTLEKLRGFVRFQGQVQRRSDGGFEFTGQTAMGWVDSRELTPVSWTFARMQDGRYETTEESENVGLEFVGDELEYGGYDYGGYRLGDSAKE